MYSYGPPHMAKQKQKDQLEHTYSSYVRIRDVALKTCQRRWMIGRSGERGSGISVLAAWHDDDIHLYLKFFLCSFCLWLGTEMIYFCPSSLISFQQSIILEVQQFVNHEVNSKINISKENLINGFVLSSHLNLKVWKPIKCWGINHCSSLSHKKPFKGLMDFNGRSTYLGLFYAQMFGNHIHCMFIFIFLYYYLLLLLLLLLLFCIRIWIIFKQIYFGP